jgi:tRNA G37 N-methylase TrmD
MLQPILAWEKEVENEIFLNKKGFENSRTTSSLIIPFNPLEHKDIIKQARFLYVDAEWYWKIVWPFADHTGGKRARPIAYQIAALDMFRNPVFAVYLLEESFPLPTLDELPLPKDHMFSGKPIYVGHVTEQVFYNGIFSLFEFPNDKYVVELFHSPLDLEFGIGKHQMQEALTNDGHNSRPMLQKRRNITGCVPYKKARLKIVDRIGMFNSSLENAIAGVGLDAIGKQFVHVWNQRFGTSNIKETMNIPAKEAPNEFFTYAMGDVLDLPMAVEKRVSLYNIIMQDAFGFDPGFTVENVPNSSGKLVWTVFRLFLMHKYPELYKKTFEYTDCLDDKHRENVGALKKQTLECYDQLFQKLNNDNGIIHGLGMGSIQNFACLAPANHTGSYGAVVHGGRCANERWYENTSKQRIDNVVDPDLSSCYGTALESFSYPFGIPTIVGASSQLELMTWGEALRKYKKELVPGLWVAYLEGSLQFEQDILVSKYNLSNSKVVSTILGRWADHDDDHEKDESEIAHIVGDFEITKNELKLSVLTDASWRVIEKVASDQELKQIKKLKVAALVYYPKSKYLTNEEWATHKVGSYIRDDKNKGNKKSDQRSRYWTSISLGEFISPLKTKRGEYKKLAKAAKGEGNEEKAKYYDGLQTSLKLIVNTTYGCLASPFFPMGNTIVANNITDKARVGAWMMSKALQTVQSITDGGAFSANEVSYLRPEKKENKKPGLHVLADRQRLRNHRCIETLPLFPELNEQGVLVRDWLLDGGSKPNPDRVAELNKRVSEQINKFWSQYGLELPFAIEVKEDHTAEYMVYKGKADYMLVNPILKGNQVDLANGQKANVVYKTRGAKSIDNVSVQHLLSLALPNQIKLDNCVSIEEQTVGINQYKHKNDPDDQLTPGNVIFKTRLYIPNPYKGKICNTYEELERLEKGAEKHKARFREKNLPLEVQQKLVREYIEFGRLITKIATPDPYKPKATT